MRLFKTGLEVEWDDNKNTQNLQKHKIGFDMAALVFLDENRLEYYDEKHSVDEDRYIVIGCVEDVLFVVYTVREEAHRIISARLATQMEKELYYGNC